MDEICGQCDCDAVGFKMGVGLDVGLNVYRSFWSRQIS